MIHAAVLKAIISMMHKPWPTTIRVSAASYILNKAYGK